MRGLKTVLTGTFVMLLIAATTVSAGDKIAIEKLDDLPRHTYQIDVTAAELLDNAEAAKKLGAELEADLRSDLETYDIGDKTTVQGYYATLGTIAFLDGRLDDTLKYVDKRRALEDKEAVKLTMGMQSVALVKASNSPNMMALPLNHLSFFWSTSHVTYSKAPSSSSKMTCSFRRYTAFFSGKNFFILGRRQAYVSHGPNPGRLR